MAKMEEIKGKINQAAGELTDDQQQILKGHVQEAIGKGKDKSEDSMNDLSKKVNEAIEKYKRENRENK